MLQRTNYAWSFFGGASGIVYALYIVLPAKSKAQGIKLFEFCFLGAAACDAVMLIFNEPFGIRNIAGSIAILAAVLILNAFEKSGEKEKLC